MVDIKSISKGHAIYINLIRYSLLKWQVSRRRRLGTIHSKIPPEAISEVEAWKKQVQGVRVWRGQYGNLVAGGGGPDGGDWCQELSVSAGWMLFWKE